MNTAGNVGQRKDLVLFSALLAWCVALLGLRIQRTGNVYFLFLLWNLFLACVPLFASRLLRAAHERKAADFTQLGIAAVWLLFLPNAPYILTDMVHLRQSGGSLYWYDLALLLSCAGTGLLLGYASLSDVQRVFEERFGTVYGWSMAATALILSGYGVYLGRVWRWNSWDVIVNPRGLFDCIADCIFNPSLHIHTYAVSGLFGVGLLLGYVTLRSMSSWRGTRAAN